MTRLYYGWVMLLTVSFTEMISWGVLYYAFTDMTVLRSRNSKGRPAFKPRHVNLSS